MGIAQQLRILAAPAVGLTLALALCGRALLDRSLLMGAPGFNDLLRAFGPFHHFYRRALLSGEWPGWNPHLFAGTPSAMFGQTGLFYPFNALTLTVPSWDAMNLQIALHLFLAFCLAHGAARLLGLGRHGALAAAGVWTLSGLMAGRVHEGHLTIIQALAWYPVAWAGLVATVTASSRRRRQGGQALTVVGYGAMGLAGAPQIWMFALILAAATVAAWLALGRRARPHGGALRDGQAAAGAVALAVALAAVEWLPIVLAGARGARAALGPEFDPALLDFPLLQLVALPFPHFFGDPVHTEFAGPGLFGETLATPGPVALALAVGWMSGRLGDPSPLRATVVATAALALALALGTQAGLYGLLEAALPPMRQVVGAGRFLFHGVWMVALAAGLGLDGALARFEAGKPLLALRPRPAWLAGIALAALFAGALALARSGPWNGTLALAAIIRSGAMMTALALALVTSRRLEWKPAGAAAVLLAVLALDLWTANARHFTSGPIEGPLPFSAALADQLDQHTRGGRVQNVVFEYVNQSLIQGYEDVNGYGVNMPASFARMAAWSNGQAPRYGRQLVFNRSSQPFCHWFAVNTLIAYADQDDLPGPWERVWSDGDVALWRQPVALPRARIVRHVVFAPDRNEAALFDPPDPRLADTLVVHAEPDAIPEPAQAALGPSVPVAPHEDAVVPGLGRSVATRTFLATLSQPGWLLIHETWDPGWRLRVNGRRARLFRAQHCLAAVYLDRGRHQIDMTYRPPGLIPGAGIALLALAGLLAMTGALDLSSHRNDHSGAAAGAAPPRKATPRP